MSGCKVILRKSIHGKHVDRVIASDEGLIDNILVNSMVFTQTPKQRVKGISVLTLSIYILDKDVIIKD